MARLPRTEVFDPREVCIVHVCNRTTRRCFLFGSDPLTGKNFDHRKLWIEHYLQHFAACFGIDLIAFAILSNHFHLILRSRPDVVIGWDDTEVARRWLRLCPNRRAEDGTPAEPSESELNSIRKNPVRLAQIRGRLSDLSWWMRLLCQRVAQRANREEEETGRFFQDRYRAVRLIDEPALLACAAYVDLNPIRAAIADTIEASDHTSAQRRMKATAKPAALKRRDAIGARVPVRRELLDMERRPRCDAFLSPLAIDELADPTGPHASTTPYRCSDKGIFGMSLANYLDLLNWTARQVSPGKRGGVPADSHREVTRLGLDTKTWVELVGDFGKLFFSVAGHPRRVDLVRSNRTHRRFRLRPRVRELMSVAI